MQSLCLEEHQLDQIERSKKSRLKDDLYELTLDLIFYQKSSEKFRVVVIGANDGISNDPLYSWIECRKTKIELVCIEPQKDIFDILKLNLVDIPCVHFINLAVGEEGELNLFRIDPRFQRHYKGIIASGIASQNKHYVESKIRKNLLIQGYGPDDLLEEIRVQAKPLKKILADIPGFTSLDALQIDTEGFDDHVLYNSSIDFYKPKIIRYEFIHLGQEKHEKLKQFLVARNYKIYSTGGEDEIAFRFK